MADVSAAGQPHFYHYDGLGSTAAVTDSSGSDVAHLGYRAFGDTTLTLGSSGTRAGFVGRYGVEATKSGLQFMRDRFYEAGTGLFLSKDPEPADVDEFLSSGLYLYANGDPTVLIDPDGHRNSKGKKLLKTASSSLKQAVKQMASAVGTLVPATMNAIHAVSSLIPAAKSEVKAIGTLGLATKEMLRSLNPEAPSFRAGVAATKDFSLFSTSAALKLGGVQSLAAFAPTAGKFYVPLLATATALDVIDRVSARIHHRPETLGLMEMLMP